MLNLKTIMKECITTLLCNHSFYCHSFHSKVFIKKKLNLNTFKNRNKHSILSFAASFQFREICVCIQLADGSYEYSSTYFSAYTIHIFRGKRGNNSFLFNFSMFVFHNSCYELGMKTVSAKLVPK